MQVMCRICPNTAFWTKPTPKKGENAKAHTKQYGFGFEDWLNREEWVLSGYKKLEGEWRYAHIAGLQTPNHAYDGEIVDILLFVKNKGLPPQAVGILREAFVLNAEEAAWAVEKFATRKWLNLMHAEVKAIGGSVKVLPPLLKTKRRKKKRISPNYFNIRFRVDNLQFFDERRLVQQKGCRYKKAYQWNGIIPTETVELPHIEIPPANSNSRELARFSEAMRKRKEYTGKSFYPRQAPIQNALAIQLQDFYAPKDGVVTCEDNGVDIKLIAPNSSVTFIEIKPAKTARQAIRQALGQLLEYSHYPQNTRANLLVIVSDVEPTSEDTTYLEHLAVIYALPVRYLYWPDATHVLSKRELKSFVK